MELQQVVLKNVYKAEPTRSGRVENPLQASEYDFESPFDFSRLQLNGYAITKKGFDCMFTDKYTLKFKKFSYGIC